MAGSIELAGSTLTAATIEADLTRLVSDRPRRDGAIQRELDTAAFPTATFVQCRVPAEAPQGSYSVKV